MFDDDDIGFPPLPASQPKLASITRAATEEEQRVAKLASEVITVEQQRTGFSEVRYMSQIEGLIKDVELLRAYSVKQDRQSGVERIINPVMFEKAIARRTAILATAVRLVREIWSVKGQEDFYASVLYAIMQESPHVRERMIDRLSQLNMPVADAARLWKTGTE